ncbi:MAG: protein phosphatase 2C domain-containing protein [Clostridiales bacterium]|nr:protein phosphatase 2C domain-containing protein [Clostridiales bacterium]
MNINKYTKAGEYHKLRGEENQDRLFFSKTPYYVLAAAADGATECKNSGEGAETACLALRNFIEREGEKIYGFSDEKTAYLLIEHILYFLESKSGLSGKEIQEYGSTLAAAYINKKTGETIFINLGDGCVFSICGGSLKTELKPKRFKGGPCLTTTEGAYRAVEIKRVRLKFGDSVMLCTDGFLNIIGTDNRRRGEISKLIKAENFEKLNSLLDKACEKDDFSYIAVKRTLRKR